MPQLVQAEGLGTIEFPDDASPEEIAREVNRIDLAKQMDAARNERSNSFGALATGAANSFATASGKALKGLAGMASQMPASEPGYVMPPEERALEERAANQTPGERYQSLTQSNPLFEAGQTAEDFWNKELPLAPQEERGITGQAGRAAGSLAALVPMGTAAPAVMGLSSAGEHITSDFESAKQAGLSDDAAAEIAMRRAMASGTLQAGIFAALPPAFRKVAERYLVDRFGQAGVARFLAGRAAAGTEGAALGASSQAAENVVEGRPLSEGTLGGAAGMAAMNLALPWLHAPKEGGPAVSNDTRPAEQAPAAPSPSPEAPAAAQFRPTLVQRALEEARAARAAEEAQGQPSAPAAAEASAPEKAEVTRNLAAELEAAMRGNQLAEAEDHAKAPRREEAGAENVAPGANGEEVLAQKEAEAAKAAINAEPQNRADQKGIPEGALASAENGGIIAGSSVEKWADEVLRGSGVHGGPDVFAAYAIKGAAIIERGIRDFSGWTAEMVARFGEAIKPHLDEIWSRSNQVYQNLKKTEALARSGDWTRSLEIAPRYNEAGDDFSEGRTFKYHTDPEALSGAESAISQAEPGDHVGLWSALWKNGERSYSVRAYKERLMLDLVRRAEERNWHYGLRYDPKGPQNYKWTLYVDTPEGQASFHLSRGIALSNGLIHEVPVAEVPGAGELQRSRDALDKEYEKIIRAAPLREFHGNRERASEIKRQQAEDYYAKRAALERSAEEIRGRFTAETGAEIPSIFKDIGYWNSATNFVHPEEVQIYRPARPYLKEWSGIPGETERVLERIYSLKTISAQAAIDKGADASREAGFSGSPASAGAQTDAGGLSGRWHMAEKEPSNGDSRVNAEPQNRVDQKGIVAGTKLEEWANKELRGGGTHLGPDVVAAYAIKGAAILERGIRNFAEWSAEMVKELGDRVKPHLDRLWAESLKQRLEVAGNALSNLDRRTPGGGLDEQTRKLRYAYTREMNALQKELYNSPEHVGDLLKQMDKLTQDMDRAKKAGNGLTSLQSKQDWDFLSGQLEKVDPKLLNRVYNDLVAKREIMGSNLPELPKGRTLDDLVHWIDGQLSDSPKASARERFGMAQRLSDELSRGKAAVLRMADRVSAAWEAFKEQYRRPPVDGDFRRTVKEWFFEKQWTGLETNRWVQSIKKAVPSALRRSAISVYLDAHGDEALLRSQADMLKAKYKPIWETALRLTDGEKALANRIRMDFRAKLDDGQNLGLIQKGREDYGVPQVWRIAPKNDGEFEPFGESNKTPRNPKAKLDPRDPFFALERKNPSYFDGIMLGGEPKGLDIGDLVGLYNAEFHNSLADRSVIKALKDARDTDGNPIVMLSGGVHVEPAGYGPEGNAKRVFFVDSNWRNKEAVTKDGRPYRTLDHWALRDWVVKSRDAEGNPIIVRGDFQVHPDYWKFLKNELSKSWMRDPDGAGKYFNWVLNSAGFLKASKFASATFHMVTIGEHAMFHAVSPITRGVDLDPSRNPKLAKLMYHGLELGFGTPQSLFEEGVASHGGIFSHVPGLGDAMHRMSDFLFKRYIPAIKAKAGEAVLDRNMARYGKKLSEEQIYELTAQQMNAAFGMQNWRLLGTNKAMLDMNRLLLTAPDFLLARAKVVGQALKPYNREQRYFLLAQAALVYGAARALNMLLDGDPHWEAENALSVVYKGRAYAARFLVNDIWHLVNDPSGFAQGRLGPIPRSLIEATTRRDMRTGARLDVPYETSNATLQAAQILVKDMAEWLIPVGTEGLMPGAKGKEQTGPGQIAFGLLGVGSHKYTSQTQVYNWARDFNRDSTDPATRLYQKGRDAEARGDSAYRKLDALLDSGDLKRAAREYESLLEEGRKPESIEAHYNRTDRPFTGSGQREEAFLDSLNADQRKIYDRAIQERAERADAFEKMLDEKPEPAMAAAGP